MRHADYSVGWICALPTELAAAVCMLDERHSPLPRSPSDGNTYVLGRIKDHNVVITALPAGVLGNTSAARVAEQMRCTFPAITYGLMVGIGGGVPSEEHDIRLGDVVVSTPSSTIGGVIQYDFGKSVQNGRFVRTGSLNKPPDALLKAMTSLQARHMYEGSLISDILHESSTKNPRWQQASTYLGSEKDKLYNQDYQHPENQRTCVLCDPSQIVQRPERQSIAPVIHYGLIASGNQVMRNGSTREQLRKELDVLCFEMEAAGLMDGFPCLIIRGICDYADSHKNKSWQDYAAAVAAAYAKELLGLVMNDRPCANHAHVTPIRNTYFLVRKDVSQKHVVREKILAGLNQHLDPKTCGKRPGSRLALIGMSGCGKSELTAYFAKLHRYKYNAVIWLDCSSEREFQQSCIYAAGRISKKTFLNSRASVSWLQDWLSDNKEWLLILDSLDDDEMQTDIKSKFLTLGMDGDILVTSRDFDVGIEWFHVAVGEMQPSECLELLQRLLGDASLEDTNNRGEVFELLKELGYLAIAINHAGHYIRQQCLTIPQYLELLRGSKSPIYWRILSKDKTANQSSLWAALDLSFKKLKRTHDQAPQILFMMALLESESIELDLLSFTQKFQGHWAMNGEFQEAPKDQKWLSDEIEGLLSDRYKLLSMVAYLRRFAFVQLNENEMIISLHPLIQKWTQQKMRSEPGLEIIFKTSVIGLVCSKLLIQDQFPPYFIDASRGAGVEDRKLCHWPWRQYHHLSKHALRCIAYSKDLSVMTAITISQSLALLQFLEYTAYSDYTQHQQLRKDVEISIHKKIVIGAFDTDKFLYASLLVWRLRSCRLCPCGKAAPNQNKPAFPGDSFASGQCEDCRISIVLAQEFMNVAQPSNSTVRVSGVLMCLHQAYQRLQLNKVDESSVTELRHSSVRGKLNEQEPEPYSLRWYEARLHANQIRNSWIVRYLQASQTYERNGLCALIDVENDWTTADESDLRASTETFRELIGYCSDEHRRSLWHLTTSWHQRKLWSRVIEALEPLVEDSKEYPVADWNHERCIIRLVSTYLKVGNRTEAARIFESTKAAYEDRDISLRMFASNDLIHQEHRGSLEDARDVTSGQAPGEPELPWQIFVKTLTSRTMTINASPDMLVDDLMHALEAEGIGFPEGRAGPGFGFSNPSQGGLGIGL